MAVQEVYIGSMGPLLYDDAEPMPGQEGDVDPDLQVAIRAPDQIAEFGNLIIGDFAETIRLIGSTDDQKLNQVSLISFITAGDGINGSDDTEGGVNISIDTDFLDDRYVQVGNLASQAEAETGTDNAKWMSPLRVAQAISEQESGDTTYTAGSGLSLSGTEFSLSGDSFTAADYVHESGGSFSGNITIPAATADGHAVNRITGDGRWAQLSGATFSGDIGFSSGNNEVGEGIAPRAYRVRENVWDTGDYYRIKGSSLSTVAQFAISFNDDDGGGEGDIVRYNAFGGSADIWRHLSSLRFDGSLIANGTTIIDSSRNITNAGTGDFSGNVTIPNATSGTHAVNRQTGDGRWGQLDVANEWAVDQNLDFRFITELANITGAGSSLAEWRTINPDESIWARIGKQSSSSDEFSFGAATGSGDNGVSLWRFRLADVRVDNTLDARGLIDVNVSGENAHLLRFNTERSWSFKQRSTGATTRLALQASTANKLFDIEDSEGDWVVRFRTIIGSSRGLDIDGNYRINGIDVIDSSRNLTNIGTGNFSGNITIPNATSATHAVNRQTGDGRWLQLSNLATVGSSNTNSAVKYDGSNEGEGVFYDDGGLIPQTIWFQQLNYGGEFRASYITAVGRVEGETVKGIHYSSDNSAGVSESHDFIDGSSATHNVVVKDGIITQWNLSP